MERMEALWVCDGTVGVLEDDASERMRLAAGSAMVTRSLLVPGLAAGAWACVVVACAGPKRLSRSL